MNKPHSPSVDEARILPHLRERARLERAQADTMREQWTRAAEDGSNREAPRTRKFALVGEPGDLRGIPAIARGVGGASPGTRPEDSINRIDKQRGRAA